MELTREQKQLRNQLFTAMLEAVMPFKPGEDQELTLELLIDAAQRLEEHFEHELEELRLEQAE
jgi:hypothetical protein